MGERGVESASDRVDARKGRPVTSRLVVSSRGHRGLVWPVSSLGVSDLAFLFADMLNGVDIDHRPVACSLVSPLFIGQGSS